MADRMKENYITFTIPEGEISIRWPFDLSKDSTTEMCQFLELVTQAVTRRAALRKDKTEEGSVNAD